MVCLVVPYDAFKMKQCCRNLLEIYHKNEKLIGSKWSIFNLKKATKICKLKSKRCLTKLDFTTINIMVLPRFKVHSLDFI